MFTPMDETEAAKLLIAAIEAPITANDENCGSPYLFRAMAIDNLVRTALDSERRETVKFIADALRRGGYRRELERVMRKLDSMPRPHDERKRVNISKPPARASGAPQPIKLK